MLNVFFFKVLLFLCAPRKKTIMQQCRVGTDDRMLCCPEFCTLINKQVSGSVLLLTHFLLTQDKRGGTSATFCKFLLKHSYKVLTPLLTPPLHDSLWLLQDSVKLCDIHYTYLVPRSFPCSPKKSWNVVNCPARK